MRHRSRQLGSWAPLVQLTNLCILAAVVVQPSNANLTSWNKVEMMKGTSFWDHFSFFTAPDPTHGYINYVSEDTARYGVFVLPHNFRQLLVAHSRSKLGTTASSTCRQQGRCSCQWIHGANPVAHEHLCD